MDWYETIFELIDMRSFSNLWYWIALAVLWSTVSHWILGVPIDMVHRARRQQGQSMADLETMVGININRMLYIADTAGLLIVAVGSAGLTTIATLGFLYEVEFAQAIFLLGFPVTVVALVSLRHARRIAARHLAGEDLCRSLSRLRVYTQIIGVISIFFTALWGMYQNMTIGILGG